MLDSYESFDKIGLDKEIVDGLNDSNHFRCTQIQRECILNFFNKKKNLIIQSPSGTGKTCAFSINLLETIYKKYFTERTDRSIPLPKGHPIALIISPTAELCQQIEKEIARIARHLPLSIAAIASSINMEEEWSDLVYSNILIATLGIINKFLDKKKIKLNNLICLVIDEWDKIFSDNNFMKKDITKILKRPMPCLELTMVSSATFSDDAYKELYNIVPVSWSLMRSDEKIQNGHVRHLLKRIGSFEKRVIFTIHLLRAIEFQQALIFCNIQDLANDCVECLNSCGFPSFFISSKVDQKERLDIVEQFRDLQLRCLVTTDLVSRGLDVPNVNIVINLDMAHDPETFVHRVGRVGRFGTDGFSVTLFKRGESKEIPCLKKATGFKLESFSFSSLPKLHLPPIRNEEQLANFEQLIKIQEDNKDADFCSDSDSKDEEEEERENEEKNIEEKNHFLFTDDYWSIYKEQMRKFLPYFNKESNELN